MIDKWINQGRDGGWNVVSTSGRIVSHHETKAQAERWALLVQDHLHAADQDHSQRDGATSAA